MAEAEVRRPKLTLQWEKAQYALDRKYRRLLSQLLKSVEDHPDKLQKRVREVRESLETARVVEIQARLGPKYLRIPSRKVILKGPLKSVGGVLI